MSTSMMLASLVPLVPLGLLGLLSLIVLIIIYIIRPNYQIKYISSTYVWQLSLKYKKKKLPTNRIRNLIVFLCQVLILVSMAGILTQFVWSWETVGDSYEVIAVLDSSASMYAGSDEDTRFLRALDEMEKLSEEVFRADGSFTFIVANDDPGSPQEFTKERRDELKNELEDLRADPNACYYGESQLGEAMRLCEEMLSENPSTYIYLFTDVSYGVVQDGEEISYVDVSYAYNSADEKRIKVVSVADDDEWNASILNAEVELVDNYYTLTVEVASFGRDLELGLNVNISGANSMDVTDAGRTIELTTEVFCNSGVTETIIFREEMGQDEENLTYFPLGLDQRFFSYRSIHVYINEMDSFTIDNNFDIYGGQKEVVKVQYASSLPNPFFTGALDTLTKHLASKYELRLTEVPPGGVSETEGFDLYIFEHTMPEEMPTDGAVFLVDPDFAPKNSNFLVREPVTLRGNVTLMPGDPHPITQNLIADNIMVRQYVSLTCDPAFQTLLWCNNDPVLLVRNEKNVQVAIMAFSLHYSNLAVKSDFYILMSNIFDCFLPGILEGNTYSIGEEVAMNSRGPLLTVTKDGDRDFEVEYESFPAAMKFDIPGTYTVKPTSYYDETPDEINIYIRIPSSESNISRLEDLFESPYREAEIKLTYDDLLIYLAAALVAVLFIEWWLQWREYK